MTDADRKLFIRSALHRVPLCGCGNQTTMWEIVRMVLRRNVSKHLPEPGTPEYSIPFKDLPRGTSCYDACPELDLSATAVEFVAQVLSEIDLTEHGTSIGYGWLTLSGRYVLGFLEKYGCDAGDMQTKGQDGKWPPWADTCDVDETFSLSNDEMKRRGAFNHGGYDNEPIEIP